jgi:L-fuculose-phosphate aldolase
MPNPANRFLAVFIAPGEIKPIQPELGREAQAWVSGPKRINATFAYYMRRVTGG